MRNPLTPPLPSDTKNMSTTPRTDAAENKFVPADFARKLETELAESKIIIAELQDSFGILFISDEVTDREIEESGIDIKKMADEVRERIQKARERLRVEEIALGIPECELCNGKAADVREKCTHI